MDPEKAPLITTSNGYHPHPVGASFPSAAVLEQDRSRNRSQRRKRILGHIIAFVLLFFAVRFLIRGAFHFDGHRHGYHSHHPHWNGEVLVDEGVSNSEWPIPPGMTVQHCAEWSDSESEITSDGSFNIENSFKLPISSDLLFLVARGPFSIGHVSIVQSDEEGDDAVVSVITNYEQEYLLSLIKLCSLIAQEGENGIGIFTVHPHPKPRHTHRIHFNVTVTLPKGSRGSPLVVPDFQTKMGIFGHDVADLGESVFFNSISLAGALGPINVDSLAAGSATMTTVSSPIEGNFTVRDSLKLSTANAHIYANVDLLNEKGSENSTYLIMDTANAPIRASVSLFSLDSDESTTSGGTFDVKANTANGAINVTFPTAPIDSLVALTANTAMAPIVVDMHNTFEGSFVAHSTPFTKVTVDVDDTEDPTGEDRKRNLNFDSVSMGTAKGRVLWGDKEDGKDYGSVKLDTALGSVSLSL